MHPGHEELAAGAVVDGEQPVLVLNTDIVRAYAIDAAYLDRERERQLAEIARRRALYLHDRPRAAVAGRTAIVVDDGVATGATVRAALQAVRRSQPRKLVLAVPVADSKVLTRLAAEADQIVCLHPTKSLRSVGQFYRDFSQVEDAEVISMLADAGLVEH